MKSSLTRRKGMTRKGLVFLVLLATVFLAAPVMAAKPLTPETLKGGTVVDDATAKSYHGKMKFFDVRMKAEYIEGHVPGAISVPYGEKSAHSPDFDASKDTFDLSKFPSDKGEPFVVYCNGPRCWKSYKASVRLIRAGYKKVYWYRDNGFPGWKSKGFPTE